MISSKVSTSLLQQSKTTLRRLTSKKWLWTVSTSADDSPLNPTTHPISKIMGNQSKRCSRTSPWLSICHVEEGGGEMNDEGLSRFLCRGWSGWNRCYEYCRQHLGEFTQVRKQSEGPISAMANYALFYSHTEQEVLTSGGSGVFREQGVLNLLNSVLCNKKTTKASTATLLAVAQRWRPSHNYKSHTYVKTNSVEEKKLVCGWAADCVRKKEKQTPISKLTTTN